MGTFKRVYLRRVNTNLSEAKLAASMLRHSLLAKCLWAGLFATIPCCVLAGNPLVPGMGVSDPHITTHGDGAYLFAGHDPMLADWWVWSSADRVNWKQESVLRPEETFIVKPFEKGCWASFGAFRSNRCYWYFSAGVNEIGVVVADSTAGPWKDPLGKPLIPAGMVPTDERDPHIFIDDDGKAYMVYPTAASRHRTPG